MYVGLGTNLGDLARNLTRALASIAASGSIDALSSVYLSTPVGPVEQPDFWNMAIRLRTAREPRALLDDLLRIERELGRIRAEHWGPRVIDLDILLLQDRVIDEPGLTIPHPRMMERAFVLRPLIEIDDTLAHPVSGERLLDRLETGSFEIVRPLFAGITLLDRGAGTVE